MIDKNYYNILNVPKDATIDIIKRAFQYLVKKYHPDSNPYIKTLEHYYQIQESYRVLSNIDERSRYDESINISNIKYPQLALNTKYSWNAIRMSSEPQVVDVLIDLDTHEVNGKTGTKRLNLAILVDVSTSMSGARLDAVKRIIGELFQYLDKNDIISLIGFSDRARIIIPAKRVYEVGDISTVISVSGLEAGGGTEMFAGLTAGVDEILKNKVEGYLHQIILLTDGHTYGDEEKCLKLANMAAENDIGITTLGMGSEWDEIFLDKLASFSGETSQYISDGEALHLYIKNKLNHLISHEVENVNIEFIGNKTANLIYAIQLLPVIKILDIKNKNNLGHICSGEKMKVLMEYEVHPIKKPLEKIVLDTILVNAEIPTCDIHGRVLIDSIELPVVDEKTIPTLNTDVYSYVEKAILYRMEERANADIKKGNITSGTKTLQYVARKIEEMGVNQLSEFIQSEALQLGIKGKYTEEAEKKIRYGTRELCLLPEKSEKH